MWDAYQQNQVISEVSTTQELQRLQFFISNYNANFSLSIDTMNSEVAEIAMKRSI